MGTFGSGRNTTDMSDSNCFATCRALNAAVYVVNWDKTTRSQVDSTSSSW